MRHIKTYFILTMMMGVLSSCITSRDVDYLQDLNQDSQIELEHKFQAVIQPHDELSIQIGSSDVGLTKPFMDLQNGSGRQNTAGFLVDIDGNILLPILGKIHAAGLTRLQLQDTLSSLLISKNIISDPYVTVRFLNFKVFIIGATFGKVLTITNERCTFLEALAMSGDLADLVDRGHIAVIRDVNGKLTTRFLDPRKSDIFNDPFFMLQQNDMIVLNEMRRNRNREEVAYWLGWSTTLISLASFMVTLFLYNSLKK